MSSRFFQVTCRRGALDSSKASHVNQCYWKHKKEKRNSKQTQTERRWETKLTKAVSTERRKRRGEKEERRRRWRLRLAICVWLLTCCFNFAQPLLCHLLLLSLFVFFFSLTNLLVPDLKKVQCMPAKWSDHGSRI